MGMSNQQTNNNISKNIENIFENTPEKYKNFDQNKRDIIMKQCNKCTKPVDIFTSKMCNACNKEHLIENESKTNDILNEITHLKSKITTFLSTTKTKLKKNMDDLNIKKTKYIQIRLKRQKQNFNFKKRISESK